MTNFLVLGLGKTGEAVAMVLCAEGHDVVVAEDNIDTSDFEERSANVRSYGASVITGDFDWPQLLAHYSIDVVVPSPGVRPSHPLIAAAMNAGVLVRSEIDLAAERISAPMVAITGTNGKTTVTELVTLMLAESGLRVECAGNIGTPLITLAQGLADVVVAEVSSFQLEFTTRRWHPKVSVLLNIADDHFDWHGGRANYESAKAKVFAAQGPSDTLVVNCEDEPVMRITNAAAARIIKFGSRAANDGQELRLANGERLLAVAELPRALPHDLANSSAATEAALAAGAKIDAVRKVLRSYKTLAHRIEFVATVNGVAYYDDSKATNPHATASAIKSFDSVVLCAGGLNKGLDLGILSDDCSRIRGVVAFGAAQAEVSAAFINSRQVLTADCMDEVVTKAASMAVSGDAVLLSPACASFDAYSNYEERGADFARAVVDYGAAVGASQ